MGVDTHRRTERGVALLITLMTMLFIAALAAAVVLTTSSEAFISSSFRGGHQALYAAEGAAEWALRDLAGVPDWASLTGGSALSTFVDGAPGGIRMPGHGVVVDLARLALDNPGWRLYAYGPFDGLTASARPSGFYVAALIAPDSASVNRLRVRAEAFGPRGAHKVVQVTLSRSSGGVRLDSWTEVR